MPAKQQEQNPWTIRSSREIYDNPWISLTEHLVINPAGNPGIYGVVHFKNYALGVLALDEELNIMLVGQYRFPLEHYSWELPEGGGTLNQEALEGAKRELLEETGLKATSWEKILEMHLSNSVSDEKAILYLARGLSQSLASPEETEVLQLKKVHINDAFDMVKAGEITDCITVAAILQLKILLAQQGRLPL